MKQFYDFKIEKIKNLSSKDKNLRKKNLEVFNKNGFPMGMQIIANKGNDLKLLSFAKRYEEIYQYSKIKKLINK